MAGHDLLRVGAAARAGFATPWPWIAALAAGLPVLAAAVAAPVLTVRVRRSARR